MKDRRKNKTKRKVLLALYLAVLPCHYRGGILSPEQNCAEFQYRASGADHRPVRGKDE